jgi:hypothetical protein
MNIRRAVSAFEFDSTLSSLNVDRFLAAPLKRDLGHNPQDGLVFDSFSKFSKLSTSAFTSIADLVKGISVPATAPLPGAQLFVDGADDVKRGPGDVAVGIDESDINQRDVGDCYFMASVAALAKQDPAAIARMIRDNGNGTYTVTLWEKESTWFGLSSKNRRREITVDATFAPDHHAAPGDNGVEIWPMILEKAYAQMRGGYGEIGKGGQPGSAMFALTGRDAHSYSPADFAGRYAPPARGWPGGNIAPTVTWESVKAEFDAHKMVTISSKTGNKKDLLDFGVHCNHAYTIDNFYTAADGTKMVHLRNPWGYDHADVPWDQLARIANKVTVGA